MNMNVNMTLKRKALANNHAQHSCSLFKFLIRALPHWYFFTPKPDVFPFPPGFQRPYIGAMFGTNLFCIFLHLISEPPAAGEATHGYLHGGMLIDFVGQRSPAPKMRLLFFDLLILGLQILVMSVTLEKQALLGKGPSGERRSVLTDALDALGEQMRRQQDLDLEERGVLGSEEGAAAVTAGESVEMRDLGPESRGRTGGEEDGERDELLGDAEGDTGEGERDDHPLDPFYTGEYIVTRLPILDIMQSQWRSSGSTSAASATSGIQGAGRLVSRRVTFTFGGRPLGS